jgi:PAS domain S-box-containing protein
MYMENNSEAVLMAFNFAPIGIVLGQNRIIQTCNETFASMTGYTTKDLAGQSFRLFYGSEEEFNLVRDVGLKHLSLTGTYSDERLVRQKDGGNIWCRFRARSLTPDNPLEKIVMSFAVMSDSPTSIRLSKRQRQVVDFLTRGLTSKEIARELKLSPRTIEDVRCRLLNIYGVKNSTLLLRKLTNIEQM